jgi:hypothetical protein
MRDGYEVVVLGTTRSISRNWNASSPHAWHGAAQQREAD